MGVMNHISDSYIEPEPVLILTKHAKDDLQHADGQLISSKTIHGNEAGWIVKIWA